MDDTGPEEGTPRREKRRSHTTSGGLANAYAGEGKTPGSRVSSRGLPQAGGGQKASSRARLPASETDTATDTPREAQRFLEATLPRFLEQVDPSFRVPFNFKLGEGAGAMDEGAMLVPLGSFNPVPKILRAIQSDDLDSERAALQADCDNMDQAMQIIVDAYYNGFNKSLASYGHILRHITSSKESVRIIKTQLADVKTSLNIRSKELRKLWLRKTEYNETLRILDEIEEARTGWDLVERHMQMRDWVTAARVLTRCMRIIEQEEMKQIGAIYDIRLSLTDLYSKFHFKVIEELHQIIYLKTATRPILEADAVISEHLKTKPIPNDYSPIKSVNPPSDAHQIPIHLAQYMASLVESLCIVKRIKEGVDALSSRVCTETRTIIDAEIMILLSNYHEKQSTGLLTAIPTSYSENLPLECLLKSLFHNLVSILLYHKHVATLFRAFCLDMPKTDAYNLEIVWEAMQEEIVAFLRIYLAASAPAAPTAATEDIGRRKLFSFADSSAATYNVTSNKEGASAFAALQLLNPSPANFVTAYPLLQRFHADIARFVFELLTENQQKELGGGLLDFMDQFVEQAYLPHMRHHFRTRLNQAVESPDAFKPRERQRTTNGDVQNWPRSVVYCVGELSKIVQDGAHAMISLPVYSQQISEVIEDVCQSFQRRCLVAFEDATEGSLASRIVSGALVPTQLSYDVLWDKQLAESQLQREEKRRDRGLRLLSPRGKLTSAKSGISPHHRDGFVKQHPAYLYDGEEKLCRESPITRADLLLDTGRLLHLAYLAESLEWLVEELESARSEVEHKTSVSSGLSSQGGRLPASLMSGFSTFANRCLFVLKVEVRLHAFYFLDGLQKCSYVIDDETPEPDGCVVEFTKDLLTLDGILSRVLPPHKLNYVIGGLENLIATLIVSTLPRTKGFNSNGVWKMCRNVFALEQSLSQLGYAGNGTAFEHARRYYRMLVLPPDELVAHLLQPSAPSLPDGHEGAAVATSRGMYTAEEYRALFHQLKKSPLYEHVDLDHLLRRVLSATTTSSSS